MVLLKFINVYQCFFSLTKKSLYLPGPDKWNLFPFNKLSVTDLVAFLQDREKEGEGRVDREWRAVVLIRLAVVTILAGVQNHHRWLSVVPRVEVECNVCIGPGTVLQVHNEPRNKKL